MHTLGLRATVLKAVGDRDLALALRSILDDIELLQYGSPQLGSAKNLESLKERLREALGRWDAG